MSLSKEKKILWLGIRSDNDHSMVASWYNPPKLRWLPQAKTNVCPKKEIDSDKCLIACFRNNHVYDTARLGLLELTLPPFLATKYHQMNVAQLINNESSDFVKDEKYMRNAMWFINYCDTFGLSYLRELHEKNLEGLGYITNVIVNEDKIALYNLDLLCMLKSIGKCTVNKNVPLISDCAKKSRDFLQEPSIIIQLPWNTVLFHQWLVAALIEVLTFEKHTLELRYWPLPPQVEPVATQLLLLVKHLKEKIYLGFLILWHQVIDYPTVNTNHPTWILDIVVLSSLARLQFINPSTGKGHDILRSIKKLSWAESETSTGRVYCDKEAFEITGVLISAVDLSLYGSVFWLSEFSFGPFTERTMLYIKSFDIEEIITEELDLKVKEGCDNVYKNSSFSEILQGYHLTQKLSSENISTQMQKQRKDNMFKCIQENIFDKERVPKNKFDAMMEFLNAVSDSYDVRSDDKDVENLIFHAEFYADLNQYLIKFNNKETSILPQVVFLGFQIAEREKMLRITTLIAYKLGITPVDINVKKYTEDPMEVSIMLKYISEVGVRDRDWLWSQFPSQWKQPVTLTQPDINMDMPVDKIVKTCEDRIGRIIINAAQTCFDVYQKGGEIFPQWKIVQYIMPCYVAIFLGKTKTKDKNISSVNYLKLIEGFLQHYENAYYTWITNNTPRQISCIKSVRKEDIASDTLYVYCEFEYYLKSSNLLVISHIQPDFKVDNSSPYFLSMTWSMYFWFHESRIKPGNVLEHEYLKIWMLNSLSIVKDMYNVCIKSWQYPNINNLLTLPGYKQLYETNELILYISKTVDKVFSFMMNRKNDYLIPRYNDIVDTVINSEIVEFYEWRYKLCVALSTCDVQSEKVISTTDVFKSGKILLLKMFNLYKQYRKSIKNIELRDVKYLTEISEEHKKVRELYLKSDFNTLESMLPLLFKSIKNKKSFSMSKSISSKSQVDMKKTKMLKFDNLASSSKNVASTSNSVSPSKEKTSVQITDDKRNICRNCPRVKKKAGKFLICEACVQDKYPDVNYYCSVKCKEEWWRKEHKAEHLEFELGLLDLDCLKL